MKDNIRKEQEICNYLRNEEGLSWKQIAQELGLTERQVKQRLYDYYRREEAQEEKSKINFTINTATNGQITGAYHFPSDLKYSEPSLDTEPTIELDVAGLAKQFVKDTSLFNHVSTDRNRENVAKLIEQKHNKRSVKILNLSDLHVPFTDWETVYKVIDVHSDADVLMINGDLLDLFAVSKYAKDKIVAVKKEMDEAREFLEDMSVIFKDVVITDGNHERRLGAMIKNQIPVEAQFLFPSDILKVLVDGTVLGKQPLRNVHVVGSYWVKLWDVIFAHPDNYSSALLKTVVDVSQYFLLNKGIPHKAILIGHTHQAGWVVSGGIKKMETGCLCHDMDYHHGSKMTKHDWTKAHAVVQIENGTVDFNESTVIIL